MGDCKGSRRFTANNLLEIKVAPLVLTICFLALCIRVGYIGERVPATLTAGFAGLAVLLLIVFSVNRKRRVHPVAVAIGFFSAVVVLSTILNGGNYITALYRVLPPLAVALLFGSLESDELNDYLGQIGFWGTLLILADGLTMLIYPSGMYSTDLYENIWLLGYKTQRVSFGLPIVVFLCVNSFGKKGKLGFMPIAVGLVLAATSYHAGAAMGTVSVLLLIAVFYIMKLATLRTASLFVRWLLDFRFWAIVAVSLSALFAFVSQNDLAIYATELFDKSLDLSGREQIWEATVAAWAKSPLLGIGALTSPEYVALTGVGGGTNAHNFILAILQSGGVAALAAVLYAYVRAFRFYKPRTVGIPSIIASDVVLCLFIGITSCNTFELFTLPMLVLLARSAEEKNFLHSSGLG